MASKAISSNLLLIKSYSHVGINDKIERIAEIAYSLEPFFKYDEKRNPSISGYTALYSDSHSTAISF